MLGGFHFLIRDKTYYVCGRLAKQEISLILVKLKSKDDFANNKFYIISTVVHSCTCCSINCCFACIPHGIFVEIWKWFSEQTKDVH